MHYVARYTMCVDGSEPYVSYLLMSFGLITVYGRSWRTKRFAFWLLLVVSFSPLCFSMAQAAGSKGPPAPMRLTSGWELQDAGLVLKTGEAVSRSDYQPKGWHHATVPGTVLSSLVNDGVYPRSEEHTSELQSLRH